MYKAIKDNKIIAINDENYFPFLVYDEIVEDTEHTCDEYKCYGDEFTLHDIDKDNEEIRQMRANAYAVEVDNITAHIQRLRDEEQTPEIEAEIQALIEERALKVEEIKQRYPYPEGEDESDSIG